MYSIVLIFLSCYNSGCKSVRSQLNFFSLDFIALIILLFFYQLFNSNSNFLGVFTNDNFFLNSRRRSFLPLYIVRSSHPKYFLFFISFFSFRTLVKQIKWVQNKQIYFEKKLSDSYKKFFFRFFWKTIFFSKSRTLIRYLLNSARIYLKTHCLSLTKLFADW